MNKFVILLAVISLAVANPISKNNYVQNIPENLALINNGNYNQNIELLSGQYQGDIVLSEQQQRILKGMDRTGLVDVNRRWPNKVVPYVLSDVFNDVQKSGIEEALAEMARVSCLTFVPRTDEQHYVQVNAVEEEGCWSHLGFLNSGEQNVNLASKCFEIGVIIHEFLHTLGFFHMHSATERDDYVTIAWENIRPGLESQFDKYPADLVTNFGVEYDLLSVMHYPAYSATTNGYATIIPHDITLIGMLGQRDGLSDKDISRLNAMYQCN